MIGKLYVHVSDDNRFLHVHRENGFPHASFDAEKWRVLAVGVEPMTGATATVMAERGFAEYRVPVRSSTGMESAAAWSGAALCA